MKVDIISTVGLPADLFCKSNQFLIQNYTARDGYSIIIKHFI